MLEIWWGEKEERRAEHCLQREGMTIASAAVSGLFLIRMSGGPFPIGLIQLAFSLNVKAIREIGKVKQTSQRNLDE